MAEHETALRAGGITLTTLRHSEQKSRPAFRQADNEKMSETTPVERSKLLRPCHDCGHQISKEALMCPSCGRRVTFTSGLLRCLFSSVSCLR